MCFACSIEKFIYIFSLRFNEVIFASMRNKRNHALFELPCETKYSLRFQFSLPKRKRGRTLDQGYVSVSALILVGWIRILFGNVVPCLKPTTLYRTILRKNLKTHRCMDFLLLPRCDLTGRPRQAELRFVCNEAALTEFIGDIFEPQSCEYTMVVFTNKICSVPHLRCDLKCNKFWGSCTDPGSPFLYFHNSGLCSFGL
jgi:hypothetical protein